jgi:hypothetical protein
LKLRKSEFVIALIYASTLFVSGIIVQEIKKLTGISLVADEGVFLTYSHYLAGISLNEIELQHFVDYGQFYWIKCFFLVFPASLLNRVGITGVESLRLVVWIFGAFTCLALLRLANRNNVNHLKVLVFYSCAFPLGAMIRYYGIKDTLISGLLLFLFVLIGKIAQISKFEIKDTKYCVGIVLGITSFLFIQSNYIPILCVSFLLVAVLKRRAFLAFVSIGAIVIYLVFTFSTNLLSKNTSDATEILDVSNILSVKSVPGGTLIPESVNKGTINKFLDTPNTLLFRSIPGGKLVPEALFQGTTSGSALQQPVEQQFNIMETKISNLFYINFSSVLSTIVSFEGLVWLVILLFLLRTLSRFRFYSTEVVILASICLLSFLGILMYDENFGTFLRHRSQLAVPTIYCLLRIRKFKLQM